ncbi:hypothetical protein JW949_01670 [Candidatus Woesearchaeota archaeon]|nr:hypothetical protein [Candidatus Woesearchaeota archaeon]
MENFNLSPNLNINQNTDPLAKLRGHIFLVENYCNLCKSSKERILEKNSAQKQAHMNVIKYAGKAMEDIEDYDLRSNFTNFYKNFRPLVEPIFNELDIYRDKKEIEEIIKIIEKKGLEKSGLINILKLKGTKHLANITKELDKKGFVKKLRKLSEKTREENKYYKSIKRNIEYFIKQCSSKEDYCKNCDIQIKKYIPELKKLTDEIIYERKTFKRDLNSALSLIVDITANSIDSLDKKLF